MSSSILKFDSFRVVAIGGDTVALANVLWEPELKLLHFIVVFTLRLQPKSLANPHPPSTVDNMQLSQLWKNERKV